MLENSVLPSEVLEVANLGFGGSPKYVSKWIFTDEEEMNAVNDGWCYIGKTKRTIDTSTKNKSVQQ